MTGTTSVPGRLMASEIREQPAVWARMLEEGQGSIAEVARAIEARRPRFVSFVARGTSDHAALYGKYLFETRLGMPAGLASPSTVTTYDARQRMRDVLLVGVSQSGGSPDLVQTMETGRELGAITLAITNAPASPLAHACELGIDVAAGPERAVAATKTYSAQLLALYLLASHLRGEVDERVKDLPARAEEVLASDDAADLAQRYRFADRMVLTGRGYSYPTVREAALKLMETCYLSGQAFSGADLLHGPVALLDGSVPAITVVPSGRGGDAMGPVIARLTELGVDQLCVGSARAVDQAGRGFVLPEAVLEELTPLLEILPLQRLAHEMALDRGADPDAPRGLAKVTGTV